MVAGVTHSVFLTTAQTPPLQILPQVMAINLPVVPFAHHGGSTLHQK